MNPIAVRLLNQQLVAPQFSDPAEVVSYMGAMQAQEYRMMRWAVEMRTRKPSAKAFKRAFDSGRIIRLHLMRGTWQLVAAEDYWMMIGLCAPKAIAVTKGWMSSNRISIPDEELMRIRDIFAQTAADLGSATKEDFSLRRIPYQLQVPRCHAPSRAPASRPQQQRHLPACHRL